MINNVSEKNNAEMRLVIRESHRKKRKFFSYVTILLAHQIEEKNGVQIKFLNCAEFHS